MSDEAKNSELLADVDKSNVQDTVVDEEAGDEEEDDARPELPTFSSVDDAKASTDKSEDKDVKESEEQEMDIDGASDHDKNAESDVSAAENPADEEVDEVATLDDSDEKEKKSSEKETVVDLPEAKDTEKDEAEDGGNKDSDNESRDEALTDADAGSTAGPEEGSAAQADSRSVTPDSRCISPAADSDISNVSTSVASEPTPTRKKPKQKRAGDNDSLVSAEDSEDLRLMQDPIDREVEATDDYEMVEEVNERHSYATRKKSPKWKYKQPGTKFTEETPSDWLLPFQEGWMREIVLRNVSEDGSGRKPADVYYYAPNKKKLRSAPEIAKFLQTQGSKNKLDLSCFTFTKQQIYREPAEFVRHAGVGKGRGAGAKNYIHSDTPLKFRSPKTSSPVGRPRKDAGKTPTAKFVIKTSASPSPSPSPVPGSTILIGIKPMDSSTPVAKPAEGVKRSVAKKHTGKRNISQISRSSPVAEMTIKKFKAASSQDIKPSTEFGGMRLCGLDCNGRGGIPPSLHCDVCMCLFHPQCVGLGANIHIKGFTCYGCRQVASNNDRSGPVTIYPNADTTRIQPAKTVIKLVSTGGGGVQPLARSSLPTLIRAPDGLTPSMAPTGPPTLVTSAVPPHVMTLIPQPPQMTPASVSSVQLQKTLSATMGLAPRLSQPSIPTITGVRSLAPLPTLPLQPLLPQQTSQPMRLAFPNADAKSVTGQLLTLPSSLTRRVDLSKALNIRVGDQRLSVPSHFFITTAEGVKVLLPPGALPPQLVQPGSSKPLSLTFQGDSDSQTVNVAALDSGQPVPNGAVSSVATAPSPSVTADPSTGKRTAKQRKASVCQFQKLHAGFDCMLCIFRYLDITDLLGAAQVCRTWKEVASQPSLWRTVHLRWSCVADWEGAARHFRRFQTHTLDLRGMIYFDDKNRTWHQFTSVLDDLVCVRQLMFGQCPGSILHLVADKLTNLEVLYAECVTETMQEPLMWSSNTKLDLGKFQKLEKLRELKIRAVCGLILPAFSFSGGLSGLGQLTCLKTLSLTTLRELPGVEFSFLGNLENLEVLEIGDCNSWTAETFECLGKLIKLTSLRLEKGGNLPDLGLGAALAKMNKLNRLELIKYVISDGLSEALHQLTPIRIFSIWPDTEKQAPLINKNTLNAVTHMASLKELDWGIFNDKPTVENGTDDETSAARAEIERQRLQSIPIQKADPASAEQEGEPAVEFVDINELMKQLCASLPDTKIRVFRVPALQNGQALS